jgi:hypothetical protein
MQRFLLVGCAFLAAVGCSGSTDGSSLIPTPTGPTGPTTPTGSSADYSTPWTGDESVEPVVTLTGSSPRYLDQTPFSLSQTTTVFAFTSAQYTALFYALDAANAKLFLNGQSFYGYPLASAGMTGIATYNLPAGNWYLAAQANQTVFPAYSNEIFMETSWGSYPKWNANGNVMVAAVALNPNGWKSQGFTIPSGDFRARIETEGSEGVFAVMTSSQYASFATQNASGYAGGTINGVYACGGQSGGITLEIECDISLPAGSYSLVYINNSRTLAGGAGVISFFSPQ